MLILPFCFSEVVKWDIKPLKVLDRVQLLFCCICVFLGGDSKTFWKISNYNKITKDRYLPLDQN